MKDNALFNQEEMLMIRDQYVARIERLERENEELELRLRRALNQVRAVDEVLRRTNADVQKFESELVKMVDDCDILATLPDLPARPPVVSMYDAVHEAPTVIIRDVPVHVAPPVRAFVPPVPALVHSRRPMYAVTASGTMSIPSVPVPVPVPVVDLDVIEVGDEMVVEDHRQATVVAATVPAPMMSGPMPGSPTAARAKQSALSTLVARARQIPAARLRPSA